jgi:hypothetical protein
VENPPAENLILYPRKVCILPNNRYYTLTMGKFYIFKTFPRGLWEVKLTPKAKLFGLSTMLNKMVKVALHF